MHKIIIYLLICLGTCALVEVSAQAVDDSPFSAFGIGNIHTDDLVYFQGFGGLGASFVDRYHVNIKNPASYAFLNATSYDVGLSARYFSVSDGTNESKGWKGNLDYLVLGFPLRNPINASLDPTKRDVKLGMSLFLKPHSTVGYDIASEDVDANLGAFEKKFDGSGGLYKLMWGNALKYKSFSVGANVGYLFGNINYNESIDFTETVSAFENRYSIDYNVNGFIWDLGLHYNWFINKDAYEKDRGLETKILTVGVYGNSAQRFGTINDITRSAALPVNLSNELAPFGTDTLFHSAGLRGEGRLPAEIGFGATYYAGSKYTVGVNFDYGAWSGYRNSVREETLSDSWELNIGGSYIPDVKSFNNYFKRVSYKLGVFYRQDPQVIENVQITDTGLNLGATFPFYYQRKISHINAAFKFGVRGNGTPIQELYGRVAVGFTFNDDEWFLKRKYN